VGLLFAGADSDCEVEAIMEHIIAALIIKGLFIVLIVSVYRVFDKALK